MGRDDVQVVWFKRDLRVHDHEPLVGAARAGPVVPLVIVEPDLLRRSSVDPAPIVDHRGAAAEARRRMTVFNGSPELRRATQQVFERHGSRRPAIERRGDRR